MIISEKQLQALMFLLEDAQELYIELKKQQSEELYEVE